MITVETYFLDHGLFKSLKTFSDRPANIDHIEGSIELQIDGVTVISREIWDDLNDLWPYLVNAMEDLIIEGKEEVKLSYPDQPIYLYFRKKRGITNRVQIEFSYPETIKYEALLDDLYAAIIGSAEIFFNRMLVLLNSSAETAFYQDELNRVKKIRAYL
ncbi:hypothetical protein B1J93_08920 [Leptospira kirschneri serovar Pomona]|uniref:Uncharacterized protein n=1 Tax=Leptospira kirschneri serovar Pomona TaxID=561005 RepID=A0A1T1DPL4_9LEPT|nr:hypothetical protein [Leptospira kirschneri]OOV42818.1 hypothetical protein B1J93_08920 [Leptospira kirschneri serovar Pomona]